MWLINLTNLTGLLNQWDGFTVQIVKGLVLSWHVRQSEVEALQIQIVNLHVSIVPKCWHIKQFSSKRPNSFSCLLSKSVRYIIRMFTVNRIFGTSLKHRKKFSRWLTLYLEWCRRKMRCSFVASPSCEDTIDAFTSSRDRISFFRSSIWERNFSTVLHWNETGKQSMIFRWSEP